MYEGLLLFHILFAIAGLGPSASLGVWQSAFREPGEVLTVLKGVDRLEKLVITPGGTLTILTGIALVLVGEYTFAAGWVWLSLLLSIGVLGIVHGVLKPANKRMRRELQEHARFTEAFQAAAGRARRFAPAGPLAILLITLLMVLKPF